MSRCTHSLLTNPEMTSTNQPTPSAPLYSDLYTNDDGQSALVEAQAVSFRRTYDGSKQQERKKPELISIPSNNVLLDYLPSGTRDSSTEYTYTAQPSRAVAAPIEAPVRRFRGQIVKAKNAHLPDSVLAFKKSRQVRTAASTWTGGIIGLVTLGPFGAIIGASAAYGISKSVGKGRERRLEKQAGVVPPLGTSVVARMEEAVAQPDFSNRYA